MLEGKRIIIGITGSIAAYKIPLLIRLLKKEGAEVQVIMTPDARDFVTPLTLSTLSENPVFTEAFHPGTGEWNSHVQLGAWADLLLIAPLTANTLAKMAHGIADNLLLTTCLSAKCPVLFAPAMDLDMYKHPATIKNIKTLEAYGHHLIAAREGELASGLCGEGRMEEPEKIFEVITEYLKKKQRLKGRKLLVSAGPTYEAIDPVRFIGNHSSGLMGYSIAKLAAEQGAEVYLVSGPSKLEAPHPHIYKIMVMSAEEMYQACMKLYQEVDAAIMTAAVADFKPMKVASEKIKKEEAIKSISLEPTKDILKTLGHKKKPNQILIGFALESENAIVHATQKLENKNLDFIVVNSIKDEGAGFGTKTNKITIIHKNKKVQDFELKPKEQVASDIIDELIHYL